MRQILKKRIKNKKGSVNTLEKTIKSQPFYVTIFIVWILYVILTFQTPTNTSNQLNLSPEVVNILRLSIALPYLLIWFLAAYSYLKIKLYSLAIKPSAESSAFDNLAKGVLVLLSSLILSTLFSTTRSFFVDFPQWRPVLTILTNYTYVVPYLVAFIFLFKGTLQLSRDNLDFNTLLKKFALVSIPLITFAYVWLELIFTNEYRVIPGKASKFATYYLKDSIIILTIVIPALITWAISLLTIIKLRMYHRAVEGVIYKHALSSFIYGLGGVIIASIFLQALLSLGPQRLLDLGLRNLLGVIYLFLIIQFIGFFFIARGANRLIKIETV